MSSFLKNGNVGNINADAVANSRKMICERWDKMGFTTGLNGYMKDNMAILFENQASEMLKRMNEATDSQNSGSFETVVFPLVRRVFSRLLANDIVSVQAMNLPVGKLFFIKPVTSKRKWEVEEDEEGNEVHTASHYGLMGYERTDRRNGEKVNRYYLPDEVVNVDESGKTPEVVQYFKKSLYDLFYDDFLFDNSKGKVHIKTGNIQPAELSMDGGYRIGAENMKRDLQICGLDDSLRNVIIAVDGFSSYNPGRLTGPDGNEMDTEAFLASLQVFCTSAITSEDGYACFDAMTPVHFRLLSQAYGRPIVDRETSISPDGKLFLEIDLAKPVKNDSEKKTSDGYIGVDPTVITKENVADMFQVAWAQYDSLELETEISEVSFQMSEITVSVEERKLRATWSPEMAQDVAAFHNIDAEAELTAILSEQIAAEIDREILRDLRKAAPWQMRWNVNGWRNMKGFSTNYTQKDWNQTLMTVINQISAQIQKATLRGGASFCVVSAEINALLNDLEYFHVTDANAEAVQYSMGIEKVGSLQGRYQIYVDPYSPAHSIVMGHKGSSLFDTGYIYAPYVPMQLTPVIYNTHNFAPVRGIMTRYAKKCVNNKFYGAITVNGLQKWDVRELR